MIVLDENFPESQRQLLRAWHVRAGQIGVDLGRKGMQDPEILPFLLRRRRTTFFTLDLGFYQRALCHPRYCLVCLDVGQYEAAVFVRRVLQHRQLDTEAKRMGAIVRAHHEGLSLWRSHDREDRRVNWTG